MQPLAAGVDVASRWRWHAHICEALLGEWVACELTVLSIIVQVVALTTACLL
jgi:hypothetical protein